MPILSVIIPTHNRPDTLVECLRCLEEQTIARDLEVIVVSDMKDDKTAALFDHTAWRVSVKFFEIPPCQQGVARNFGLEKATGEYALFIGDDILLALDACEKHVQVHENLKIKKPNSNQDVQICVLGFTTWDPAVGITPVMTWLEQSGWQFGYPALNRCLANGSGPLIPISMQHRYTYTSNISLPLALAKKHLFRTDVHLYGWEDIEWGMRLKNAGVRVLYEPAATALHRHRITLEESLKRMEILGRSAVEISKKVPEFDRVPRGFKLLLYRIAAMLPTMAGRHRRAFLRGVTGHG